MRAMFSGAEESATVFKIESATHALIRLDDGIRATYSSDRFCLRKVSPARFSNWTPMAKTTIIAAVDP